MYLIYFDISYTYLKYIRTYVFPYVLIKPVQTMWQKT